MHSINEEENPAIKKTHIKNKNSSKSKHMLLMTICADNISLKNVKFNNLLINNEELYVPTLLLSLSVQHQCL